MISRCLLTLFVILACSCGEREKQEGKSVPEEKATTRTTRLTLRERGERSPDAKAALREDLDVALKDPDPASKQRALEQIAWEAIDVDPDLSQEAFEALAPDSEASRKLVAHFAMRLADADPEQAIEWAQGLEHAEERAEAFGRIAVVIAAKDPARGASLAMAELPAGKTRDKAVVQVVQRWSQSAPAAAAEWIAGVPAGAARSAGLRMIVDRWMKADPAALAGWVEAREAKDLTLRMDCLVAVAKALREVPDPARRAAGLSAFRDAEIRRQIENLLAQPPP